MLSLYYKILKPKLCFSIVTSSNSSFCFAQCSFSALQLHLLRPVSVNPPQVVPQTSRIAPQIPITLITPTAAKPPNKPHRSQNSHCSDYSHRSQTENRLAKHHFCKAVFILSHHKSKKAPHLIPPRCASCNTLLPWFLNEMRSKFKKAPHLFRNSTASWRNTH